MEEQKREKVRKVIDEARSEDALEEQSDNTAFIQTNEAKSSIQVTLVSSNEQMRNGIVQDMTEPSTWQDLDPDMNAEEGMSFKENVSTIMLRNVTNIDDVRKRIRMVLEQRGFTIEKNR